VLAFLLALTFYGSFLFWKKLKGLQCYMKKKGYTPPTVEEMETCIEGAMREAERR